MCPWVAGAALNGPQHSRAVYLPGSAVFSSTVLISRHWPPILEDRSSVGKAALLRAATGPGLAGGPQTGPGAAGLSTQEVRCVHRR